MSKLSDALESIRSQLHWGPAHEPFLKAVVEEFDELKTKVKDLESKLIAPANEVVIAPETAQVEAPVTPSVAQSVTDSSALPPPDPVVAAEPVEVTHE